MDTTDNSNTNRKNSLKSLNTTLNISRAKANIDGTPKISKFVTEEEANLSPIQNITAFNIETCKAVGRIKQGEKLSSCKSTPLMEIGVTALQITPLISTNEHTVGTPCFEV